MWHYLDSFWYCVLRSPVHLFYSLILDALYCTGRHLHYWTDTSKSDCGANIQGYNLWICNVRRNRCFWLDRFEGTLRGQIYVDDILTLWKTALNPVCDISFFKSPAWATVEPKCKNIFLKQQQQQQPKCSCHTHIVQRDKQTKTIIYITFYFKDPCLKLFQYSCKTLVIIYFEGIVFIWCDGFKFTQIIHFDLKPESNLNCEVKRFRHKIRLKTASTIIPFVRNLWLCAINANRNVQRTNLWGASHAVTYLKYIV